MEKVIAYSGKFADLPVPKTVDDILSRIQQVLPHLDSNAAHFAHGGSQTGICGGLERLEGTVQKMRKRVVILEVMKPEERARHSEADLLSIQRDLQHRVGVFISETVRGCQLEVTEQTNILLQSDQAFVGAMSDTKGKLKSEGLELARQLKDCKGCRKRYPVGSHKPELWRGPTCTLRPCSDT
eukprot:894492-Rhodomonas_salina.4